MKRELREAKRTADLAWSRVLVHELKLGSLDRRMWANDRALYWATAADQYDINCGLNPLPGCHVPLGLPGTIYMEAGKPRRIFATPYP